MLTEKAKQLIPKARIFSTDTIKNLYSQSIIRIFQEADNNGKYLSNSDLEYIENNVSNISQNLKKAQILRDKADEIVEKARAKVLLSFPSILEEGGDLYPPERAVACWRDFWHFLRCITYAIAGEIEEFTHEEGLKNMELLYQELKVPLPAMILGLENLKYFSLQEFSVEEKNQISLYFDHLINELKKFNG